MMVGNRAKRVARRGICVLLLLMNGLLAACGAQQETDEMKERFGGNCISGQTFEAEMSEYDGKVWFVPYAPGREGQELELQIVQDDEILTDLYPYVPESLEGQPFTSLDAVSFFDVNFDGYTDIVLVETYGDTSFMAIYYGFDPDGEEYDRSFSRPEVIADKLNPLTIGELRSQLGGKNNGEFTSEREAYRAVLKLWELTYKSELTCDLIYVDEDDTPELVVGREGYWVSMYTYCEGTIYTLMDQWPYGAMGNIGYEYIPRENRMRNYNNDFAGAILYTTYMKIMSAERNMLVDVVTQIETYHFDDANGNGMPDEEEQDSIGYYSVSYVDGAQITSEQYAAYGAGEYELIGGRMSPTELLQMLAE